MKKHSYIDEIYEASAESIITLYFRRGNLQKSCSLIYWIHLEKLFPPVFSRNDQRPHPVAQTPETRQAESAHEGPQAAHGGENVG